MSDHGSLDPSDAAGPAPAPPSSDKTPRRCRFLVAKETFDLPWAVVERADVRGSFVAGAARWALDHRQFDPTDTRDSRVPLVEFDRDVRAFRVIYNYLVSGVAAMPKNAIVRQLLVVEAEYYGLTALAARYMGVATAAPLPSGPAPVAVPKSLKPRATCAPSMVDEKSVETRKITIEPFWADTAGAADTALAPADLEIRAAETSARAVFGRGEDATAALRATLADVFAAPSDGKDEEKAGCAYPRLVLPAHLKGGPPLPLVDRLENFADNFAALTMGLDRCFFEGLPFVCAGGAPLAALLAWPSEHVPAAVLKHHIILGDEDPVSMATAAGAFRALLDRLSEKKSSKPDRHRYHDQNRHLLGYTACSPSVHVFHNCTHTPPSPSNYKIRSAPAVLGRLASVCGFGWMERKRGDVYDDYHPSGHDHNGDFYRGANDIETCIIDPLPSRRVPDSELNDSELGERLAANAAKMTLKSFRLTDIDLFLVTRDPDVAVHAITELYARIRKLIPAAFTIDITRSANSVAFIAPWPFRKIQVILRLYHSVEQVLLGFDVDCCCVAFDGRRVVASPRGARALRTRVNVLDPSRQSTTFEHRLMKYARRGFAVAVPGVDPSVFVDTVLARVVEASTLKTPLKFEGFQLLVALFAATAGGFGPESRNLDLRALRKDLRLGGSECDYEESFPVPADSCIQRQLDRARSMNLSSYPFMHAADDIQQVLTSNVVLRDKDRHWNETFPTELVAVRASGVPEVVQFELSAPHRQDRVDQPLWSGSFHPLELEYFRLG